MWIGLYCVAAVWRNRRRYMEMPGLAADAARNIKQRYPLHEGGTSMTADFGAVPRDISGQCAPAISARRWRTSVCGHVRGKRQGLIGQLMGDPVFVSNIVNLSSHKWKCGGSGICPLHEHCATALCKIQRPPKATRWNDLLCVFIF